MTKYRTFRLRDARNRFITPLFEDVKTGFGGDEMTFQGSYNYFVEEPRLELVLCLLFVLFYLFPFPIRS